LCNAKGFSHDLIVIIPWILLTKVACFLNSLTPILAVALSEW
jgi:hypothetical protein